MVARAGLPMSGRDHDSVARGAAQEERRSGVVQFLDRARNRLTQSILTAKARSDRGGEQIELPHHLRIDKVIGKYGTERSE